MNNFLYLFTLTYKTFWSDKLDELMAREIVNMEETKSKRIEMLIKEKYLLIIREVGTYFGLDKKG